MPIRAVLFDLDGTLLDRRETFRRHLELQIERHAGMFPDAQAAGYVAQLPETARVPTSHWLDVSRTEGDTWDRGKQSPSTFYF